MIEETSRPALPQSTPLGRWSRPVTAEALRALILAGTETLAVLTVVAR